MKTLYSQVIKNNKVLIVGAGPGGSTVAAQLINSGVFKPKEITIFDKSQMHHYQPGYTNIAGGVWSGSNEQKRQREIKYIMKDRKELLHPDIIWVQDNIITYDPQNNSVTTQESNEKYFYDYLVVACGIENRYDLIPGSIEALNDPNCPVGSMYQLKYAYKIQDYIQNFKQGTAIYTIPSMPIKCAGAAQKLLYLSDETFRKNNVRQNINLQFIVSTSIIFPSCLKYSIELDKLARSKDINLHFNNLLHSVDGKNRNIQIKNLQNNEIYTKKFDLLHIVPPQKAPLSISYSELSNPNGYVDVDSKTLQHKKFENVFSIGDIANLPTSKTVAAIYSQAPVLTHNLLSLYEQKNQSSKIVQAGYDGYSSCPIYVGGKKLMLVEFNYIGPKETFHKNQTVPSRIFYYFKSVLFPWIYWNIAPKGMWFGKNAIFQPKFK